MGKGGGSHVSTSAWILLIDDEAKVRFTLSVILKRAGYSVIGVENACEALQQLKTRRFHLVFLDIYMPGIGGLQLLPEIRHLNPLLPVIILTGDDSVETTLKAMNLGACGYLLKPVNPWQILAVAAKLLEPLERHKTGSKPARVRLP